MIEPPLHPKEDERLKVIDKKNLLADIPDPRFDDLTKEAIREFKVKISAISIISEDKELCKSCIGLSSDEGPRDISFCGHALLSKSVFIIEDTLEDDRFKDNPYVINTPFIRFYAGVALKDRESGLPVGVFCIKDDKPRKFGVEDVSKLIDLADRIEARLNTITN